MNIAIDTHTHTLASGHAYNTIREMVSMAAGKGLTGIAITDHAPKMPGSTHLFYFQNLKVVPRKMCGIELLMGTELNIMDEDGSIDLPEKTAREMDITVASIHPPCYGESKGIKKNTQAYINAMKKEYVDIIGHPDDGRYEVDYETLAKMAAKTGTLLEVNNSSLRPGGFRLNTFENAVKMLEFCKKYNAMVVLGSDAHADVDIAEYTYAEMVLKTVEFPEELIANTSLEKLKLHLKSKK